MTIKRRTVIIVAGGKGERMNSAVPKQFLSLAGRPVLMHTIELFLRFDAGCRILVVLPEREQQYWNELCDLHAFTVEHQLATGGSSRFYSVKNGLALAPDEGLIAVHDGVRPLASLATIGNCFNAAELQGAAIPVTDAVESIRRLTETGSIAVDRTQYKLVQTPQVFEATLLKKAYNQQFSELFTDDASVVEAFGHAVSLVPGNPENIKITTPGDLLYAEVLINQQ